MGSGFQIIAIFSVSACLLGLGWLVYRARSRADAGDDHHSARGPAYWEVIYVTEDGTLLFTTLRVISVDIEARRFTAWCHSSGRERSFKIGKIVEARDLNRGGAKVNVPLWLNRLSLDADPLFSQSKAA